MDNNEILRRLRDTFGLSDAQMMAVFAAGGLEVSCAELGDWLKDESDPAMKPCTDRVLAVFLNGMIAEKRGGEGDPIREPENELNNNMIFRKLSIALSLQAEDVLQILQRADMTIGKHQLSALFRKPGNKHYRECGDQVLDRFLTGLQRTYRDGPA